MALLQCHTIIISVISVFKLLLYGAIKSLMLWCCYTPVTLRVRLVADNSRLLNSRWSLVVLLRLPTIVRLSCWPSDRKLLTCDCCRTYQWWFGRSEVFGACTKYMHAPNTSPWPVGHREVFSSLLSVGDCHTMVFSGLRKVFTGL